MHGSELYEKYLSNQVLLHESTVKSANPSIKFVLQLKKCVDIYKKILDIDKAKEEELQKQKEDEMNKPKAAGPVYNDNPDEDEYYDPLG